MSESEKRKHRIYLASSWRNEYQPNVLAALRAAGHEVYDFRNPKPGNVGFSWKQCTKPLPWSAVETINVLGGDVAQSALKLDFDAMKWADTVVMLQPCGRSAALELGWAIGAGKHTLVLMDDGQEPELMIRLADHLAANLDELLTMVRELPPSPPAERPGAVEPEVPKGEAGPGADPSETDVDDPRVPGYFPIASAPAHPQAEGKHCPHDTGDGECADCRHIADQWMCRPTPPPEPRGLQFIEAQVEAILSFMRYWIQPKHNEALYRDALDRMRAAIEPSAALPARPEEK